MPVHVRASLLKAINNWDETALHDHLRAHRRSVWISGNSATAEAKGANANHITTVVHSNYFTIIFLSEDGADLSNTPIVASEIGQHLFKIFRVW